MILAAALLLHNLTVIDGTGAPPMPHRDVLIVAGRIQSIAPSGAPAPSPAQVIDCTGKYLIPGLIDMHVHLLAHPWDEHGNLRPRWKREDVLELLQSLLRFGVTTVRDPGSETEAAVKLRDMHPPGPRIFTAGRIINASDFDPEPFAPVHNADEVRREIDWQARAGVDVIKIYASMPPDLVKVAIDEAHEQHVPIIGHLQRTTWTEAANLGIDGVEHPAPWSPETRDVFGRVTWLEHLDDAKIDEMIRALVAHHVAAKALHREKEFGSVREGLRADLVVLERDPIADIRNTRAIAYVIQDGAIRSSNAAAAPRATD